MSGNDNEQKTKASKNDSCLKSFKLRKKIEPLHISSVRQRRCSMDRTGGGEWAGQAMGNGHGRKWVVYLVQMLSWVCTTSDEQYP